MAALTAGDYDALERVIKQERAIIAEQAAIVHEHAARIRRWVSATALPKRRS
jgi:hypothetical protein